MRKCVAMFSVLQNCISEAGCDFTSENSSAYAIECLEIKVCC